MAVEAASERECAPAAGRCTGSRWTLAARIALALVLAGAGAAAWWLTHPWYEASGSTNDGSVYLLCAQALQRGEGYSYLGEPFTMRPPGFSALLVPLLAWRGLDFHALNLYVAAFGVVALALFFAWARPRLGVALALALTALIGLNPLFRAFSNRVMSDVPALALLLATFALERWASRAPSWKRDLVLGLWIGASAYVRWVNGLALVAVIASRAARKLASRERGGWPAFARRRAALVLSVPIAVMAMWWARNAALQRGDAEDQRFSHSYFTALFRQETDDPTAPIVTSVQLAERALANLDQIARAVGGRVAQGEGAGGPTERWIGIGVGALALIAVARRRGAADFMFLGLVAAYSTAVSLRERYVLPIFVLATALALDTLAGWLSRGKASTLVRFALVAAVLALAWLDFRPRDGWEQIERRHRRFEATCNELAQRLPEGAVLAAPVGWHLAVYLRRPVFSLAPALRDSGRAEDVERVVERYGIDTVIALDFAKDHATFARSMNASFGRGKPVLEATVWKVGAARRK